MKKQIAMFLFLITLALAAQIPIGMAYQFSYDWNISNGVGGFNKYQLTLTTADSWRADTTFDIAFRLTLVSRSLMLDHTDTNRVEVVLSSENFLMDSGNQTEMVTLTDVGDYWEKKVSFYVPAEKLNRGQTLTVLIFFLVSINEVDSFRSSREYNADNYYNPMPVNLIRPILSTLELIIIIVMIILCGIGGLISYRKRKFGSQPPPTPPT